jgi:hypothetical protein
VFAFHEAFADIVALFLHFSYPGVLHHQIARTRGDLGDDNILGQLAQQFGKASGRGRALRDYLGKENKEGEWERTKPDVHELERTTEPHARGAILVAAVFNAFLTVYRSRTADLYRIASEGTGVLREGAIHPDLAHRLADEAARAAQQALRTCIRAIDYCPPVGITFGDYLRAIITADFDINPEDPGGFRLGFLESFRQWGIHPGNLRSMSAESLLWPTGQALQQEHKVQLDRQDIKDLLTQAQTQASPTPTKARQLGPPKIRPWTLETDRFEAWDGADENREALWSWLVIGKGRSWAKLLGIEQTVDVPPTVFRSPTSPDHVAVEVHSVRTAVRRSQRGAPVTDLVVEITQRRRGYFDAQLQKDIDEGKKPLQDPPDFIYRAGCTFLLDPNTIDIRRVIRTPGTITDNAQLERMHAYLAEGGSAAVNAFYSRHEGVKRKVLRVDEPFALLHSEVGG